MTRNPSNLGVLTAVAMLAATVMIAQHIAGKAARDALFLTYFDISQLPVVMMVSSGISVAAVILMSRLLTRHGPARLIPPLYLASALLLAVQWYFSDVMPQVASVALYIHVSALNSILISGFWSVINERFDPYAAKKVITRLTAATTFGGLLGGVAASSLASAADTHAILLMLSLMHLVCAMAVGFIGRGHQHPVHREEISHNIFAPLKRSVLVRRMALLALLVATTAAVLDYILKAEASAALSEEELITFFSYFYMAVGLGTFLVQSAVGDKALRWLGLGGSMAAWPLIIIATGGGALLFRSLVSVTLMRASANLLYNSFFRAGFELLYTPIAAGDKRSGKILIDVGADRSGDLLGGLLVMGILLIPVATESILLVTSMVLALVCLSLILVLHQKYVKQLADNLRNGTLKAEDIQAIDATTQHTVAATQTAIERDRLLRDIERFHTKETIAPDHAASGKSSASPVIATTTDNVIDAIIALRSNDEDQIKRVLVSHMITPALLPHMIPLLADDRVLREALRAGRRLASSCAGQLADALDDPLQHPLVRRRIPLILAHSTSALAVEGLLTGLDDTDANVRFRCAQGLEYIRRQNPLIKADEPRLLRHIEREARKLGESGPESMRQGAAGAGAEQQIQLIFMLLGALYEPEVLELSLSALQSDDQGLKGTALEYLENLLPPHIWALLHPILAPGPSRGGKRRPIQQTARDLLAAASSLRKKPVRTLSNGGGAEEQIEIE